MTTKIRKYRIGESYSSAFWGRDDLDFDEYTGTPDDPEDYEYEDYETIICDECEREVIAGFDNGNLCHECKRGDEGIDYEWDL